jgi:hypothetical protein
MPARLHPVFVRLSEDRIDGTLHASKYLHAIQAIASDYLQMMAGFCSFSDDVYH